MSLITCWLVIRLMVVLCVTGVIGLVNKCMVSSLISQYAQVVLWFCRTGLLPESAGKTPHHLHHCLLFNLLPTCIWGDILLPPIDDDILQISRPFYSFSVIKNYYTGQREELQRLAKWVSTICSPSCVHIDIKYKLISSYMEMNPQNLTWHVNKANKVYIWTVVCEHN